MTNDLEKLVSEHWNEIVDHVVIRVSRQITWTERIEAVNRFLIAAAILMAVQSAIAMLTLERLLS